MMHMWMWFGYDLGEFLFPGLTVDSRWAFALTWIALFFVSLLFEASKVYLARVQREAQKKLLPYRSDERRNLLCEREQGSLMEPTTSRNTGGGGGAVSRWAAIRLKLFINCHQTAIFLLHNVVGYLLMLAVMLYNVELLLAVIFGMMLGYFLFGTKLTRLQMQCFNTRRAVICTPECDDTAETSTPPLDGSLSLESDFFICNTRTCIQPSHYLPARTTDGAPSDLANATCYYGAKKCPSKVARLKKMQSTASTSQYSQECESPTVEDVQLLRTERQGCCKKKQEPPPDEGSAREDSSRGCCSKETEEPKDVSRDASPQITCCHASMSVSSDSQEQIVS